MVVGEPTIVVSYKRGHEASLALVTDLEAALHSEGLRAWRDVCIEADERWPDEIWRYLPRCGGAGAVIGHDAAESAWCHREWSVFE